MEFPKDANMKPPKGFFYPFGGALLGLALHKLDLIQEQVRELLLSAIAEKGKL